MMPDDTQQLGETVYRLGDALSAAADAIAEVFGILCGALEEFLDNELPKIIAGIQNVLDKCIRLLAKPPRKPHAPRSIGARRPAPAPRPCAAYRVRAPPGCRKSRLFSRLTVLF